MLKKKLILIAATVVAMISFAATAYAQETANLTLTGQVPENLSINLTNTNTGPFDLSIANPDVQVATLEWFANTGYTVTVAGSNDSGGDFYFAQTGGTGSLVYTLEVGGTASGDAVAPGGTIDSNTGPSGGTQQQNVYISYDGSSANLPAGTDYEDQLTFTITAQ